MRRTNLPAQLVGLRNRCHDLEADLAAKTRALAEREAECESQKAIIGRLDFVAKEAQARAETMRQRAADSVIDVARYRNFYEQTERECDTLRAQLRETDLLSIVEQEKLRAQLEASRAERSRLAATLHDSESDLRQARSALRETEKDLGASLQIRTEERKKFEAHLVERDAEIGRLRTLDEKTVRAGANVARKLDDALARLSELEPVAEAVQEYRDTIGTPQNMAANRRVLFGVPLPKKGPQP
jgi:chromosome segregation ATPase